MVGAITPGLTPNPAIRDTRGTQSARTNESQGTTETRGTQAPQDVVETRGSSGPQSAPPLAEARQAAQQLGRQGVNILNLRPQNLAVLSGDQGRDSVRESARDVSQGLSQQNVGIVNVRPQTVQALFGARP
jgi:hypothetical protein